MKYIDLSAAVDAGFRPALEVHGVDPSTYLVFQRDGDALNPILDERGRTLTFRSRSAAFDSLRAVGISQADFVHRTAFEEMIGVGAKGVKTEHRETVRLNQLNTGEA